MVPSPFEYLVAVQVYVDAGLIGTFGGVVNYFYFIDKHDIKFKIKDFLTNSILAFFVGIVAFFFLPDGENKAGYLMLAGFFCYKIIDFLDRNSNKMLKKLFRNGEA